MENSGELTGLRNHYFKDEKKDLLVIAEKNSTPNQILEWFVSHFVRNVKMVSKSLSIFFILILFERYHLLKWMYLSKAYKKVKTPTLQLTFLTERIQNLVYFEINRTNKLGG